MIYGEKLDILCIYACVYVRLTKTIKICSFLMQNYELISLLNNEYFFTEISKLNRTF